MPYEDGEFDAVLLLGPLYHLEALEDRQKTLEEAARVTKPGGIVVAAALSRFLAFGALSLGMQTPEPFPIEWLRLLEHGSSLREARFPAGHFHSAEELESELETADLSVLETVGVEGPAGLLLEVIGSADDEVREAALTLARAASTVPGVRDFSAHLLAVARV